MSIDLSGHAPADDFFGAPYLDADEARQSPYPFRYLHGGFAGTDTRFSMYFPEAGAWQERLLTGLGGASGGDERSPATAAMLPGSALNGVLMARTIGACYVQSNQGHIGPDIGGLKGDLRVMRYRADAETARLGKAIAARIYGRAPRAAYLYGGSGGGNRTLWGLEGCDDVWDGGVAFMFGGSSFSAQLNAARLLRPVVERVIDASPPGGGNPFDGLDEAQREALAELYRMSFPRGAEFQLRFPMPEIVWPAQVQMAGLPETDPGYVEAFWSDPAYPGAADAAVRAQLTEFDTEVATRLTVADIAERTRGDAAPAGGLGLGLMVTMAGPDPDPADALGIVLRADDPEGLTGCRITILDGPAAGRRMYVMAAMGPLLIPGGLGSFVDLALLRDVAPGTRVRVSNRELIAYCHRHRYEPSHDGGIGSEQFRVDGQPVHPQRGSRVGEHLSWTGRFSGKLILMQHLLDRPCWPSQAVAYERMVTDALGAGRDERFRLYWTENATHVPPRPGDAAGSSLAIDYSGHIERGLLDMVAWVERGIPHAAGTRYRWTRDARVVLPPDAADRRGLQPTVVLSIAGSDRTAIAAGETVTLDVAARMPPGLGCWSISSGMRRGAATGRCATGRRPAPPAMRCRSPTATMRREPISPPFALPAAARTIRRAWRGSSTSRAAGWWCPPPDAPPPARP